MWELDHYEGWGPKNWCFQTVVLEKTLQSPLDCKEIKPVNPKRNQPWIFIGRTNTEAPIRWPPEMKSWLTGKRPWCWKILKARGRQQRKRWLDGITDSMSLSKFLETGQGSHVCCSPWGLKELDMTEQLNKWFTNLLHTSWLFAKPLQTFFFFFFEKQLRAQSYKEKEWTKSVGKRLFVPPVKLCSSSWRSIKGWKKDQMRKKRPPHLVTWTQALFSLSELRERLSGTSPRLLHLLS